MFVIGFSRPVFEATKCWSSAAGALPVEVLLATAAAGWLGVVRTEADAAFRGLANPADSGAAFGSICRCAAGGRYF